MALVFGEVRFLLTWGLVVEEGVLVVVVAGVVMVVLVVVVGLY